MGLRRRVWSTCRSTTTVTACISRSSLETEYLKFFVYADYFSNGLEWLNVDVRRRGADQSESHVNESAKRTLLRLGQKLKGVEKGTPLSVNGQVNLLIQQAMDPGNLCRMYHGWRPHA